MCFLNGIARETSMYITITKTDIVKESTQTVRTVEPPSHNYNENCYYEVITII